MSTDPLKQLAKLAGMGGIFLMKDDVEFIWNPLSRNLQIGMGGEWWAGQIRKTGRTVFTHRKERVDEAYRPVTVNVDYVGHALRFAVGGGFGMGATFMVGAR